MTGKYVWWAFDKNGLKGVEVGASSKQEALKYAREIHGRGAKVEKTSRAITSFPNMPGQSADQLDAATRTIFGGS